MQVEIYQREVIENATLDFLDAFEDWEHRAQLVKALGLSGQQRYMDAKEKAEDVPFKLITPDELIIWRRYLPMPHMDYAALAEGRRRFSEPNRLIDYAFDLIPVAVLETWQRCRQMGYFESYEIWTAEDQSDPILLGHLGPSHLLDRPVGREPQAV